jgi:molybdate transport system substrate-binding protein
MAAVLAYVTPLAGTAVAAEIRVMISGGFSAAYSELVPKFESASGNRVTTSRGASIGNAPNSIPNRLERGELVDVFIMVGDGLDVLSKQGLVTPGSRVDLARSSIAMAVRAGAPKPDIGSLDAFKRAMLSARSIAYSSSASGVYLSTEVFVQLGIADQLRGKSKMSAGEPVGVVVARGDAEVGFQQLSELLPVPGIEIVGLLPAEIQRVTVFSAGIAAGAKEPGAGAALIRFLASPASAPTITRTALEPIVH